MSPELRQYLVLPNGLFFFCYGAELVLKAIHLRTAPSATSEALGWTPLSS